MKYLRIKVFSCGSNETLAAAVCERLSLDPGKITMSSFADGESYCRIDESVRGCDTFIIQPICAPVNENLMKLLIATDALRRASAGSITAVVPYLGYSRQEKKRTGREPITAKLVANLLTTAGLDRIVTLEMHAPSLQGFYDIPVDHISSARLFAKKLEERDLSNSIIVSPDTGGVTRARHLGRLLDLPMAIIDKRRPEPNDAVVMNIVGDVADKDIIIVDDIIDTAGTLKSAVISLKEKGAKRVTVCGTHPVFSGPAMNNIINSEIDEIFVTNSIPVSEEMKKNCNIEILSIAGLLGQTIKSIFEKRSVSELLEDIQL
ncbi:MAG: ribose-phosphate pyrophosphokinase [Candidatus Riflebacteria bacterium]|nr:ribose-phosphate pyrophosphokinase [Candidatus Riflebacteria bacterium]